MTTGSFSVPEPPEVSQEEINAWLEWATTMIAEEDDQ